MLDKNAKLLPRENLEHEIVTILGSWVDNFKYWYNYKNCLLIRYEDMINNKSKVILELINYFKMFIKTDISEEKINNTIKSTSFSNMQKQEVKGFFKESVTVDKKKIQFFNKGKSKNWVGNLDKKIQNKLEKAFYNEMKFLGYL